MHASRRPFPLLEVVPGHAAAENFLCEYHFFFVTGLQTGTQTSPYWAAATGLLLELALLGNRFADFLEVRALLGGIQNGFYAETALSLDTSTSI